MMKSKYDYLIVGSGLYGATFAYRAKQAKRKCLLLKSALILGEMYIVKLSKGSMYTNMEHIFHTNNKQVWDFVNSNGEVLTS